MVNNTNEDTRETPAKQEEETAFRKPMKIGARPITAKARISPHTAGGYLWPPWWRNWDSRNSSKDT
jgi:hypothetical protein